MIFIFCTIGYRLLGGGCLGKIWGVKSYRLFADEGLATTKAAFFRYPWDLGTSEKLRKKILFFFLRNVGICNECFFGDSGRDEGVSKGQTIVTSKPRQGCGWVIASQLRHLQKALYQQKNIC